MTNDYTTKIYQVVEYFKKKFPELTINLFCYDLKQYNSEDNYISGRCDYHTATIMINEPDAKQALETILHEGGHYSHFKKSKLSPDDYMKTENREFFANEESQKIRKELNV